MMKLPLCVAAMAITLSVASAGPPTRIVSTARMLAATQAGALRTQLAKAEGNHAGYAVARAEAHNFNNGSATDI